MNLQELSPEIESPVVPFPVLAHYRADWEKDLIFSERRSAIHGGKLGDIIYALPACRALGINHLILNVYEEAKEPLRQFSFEAARQLVPLLLAQDYLQEVSITRSSVALENFGHRLGGISYNFDLFRKVPRHLVGRWFESEGPDFLRYREEDLPAHLSEHFAATVGVRVSAEDPWLRALPATITRNKIVISITHNWRSYSQRYWEDLLTGLPKEDVIFVGTPGEWQRAGISNASFLACADHKALASALAGCRLFLGTVSFPYALAEGLKIPRGVEICRSYLNAFPTGTNGFALHPDINKARSQVALWLNSPQRLPYMEASRRIEGSGQAALCSLGRTLAFRLVAPNERWPETLRRVFHKLLRPFLKPLKLLAVRTV